MVFRVRVRVRVRVRPFSRSREVRFWTRPCVFFCLSLVIQLCFSGSPSLCFSLIVVIQFVG